MVRVGRTYAALDFAQLVPARPLLSSVLYAPGGAIIRALSAAAPGAGRARDGAHDDRRTRMGLGQRVPGLHSYAGRSVPSTA